MVIGPLERIAHIRAIEDFINGQGTVCGVFVWWSVHFEPTRCFISERFHPRRPLMWVGRRGSFPLQAQSRSVCGARFRCAAASQVGRTVRVSWSSGVSSIGALGITISSPCRMNIGGYGEIGCEVSRFTASAWRSASIRITLRIRRDAVILLSEQFSYLMLLMLMFVHGFSGGRSLQALCIHSRILAAFYERT